MGDERMREGYGCGVEALEEDCYVILNISGISFFCGQLLSPGSVNAYFLCKGWPDIHQHDECIEPEIPSYVGYVYRNKPKLLDSWFLVVAYIGATKLFLEYLRVRKKRATNTTNSILTHATRVRFSSYPFVVFFMLIHL